MHCDVEAHTLSTGCVLIGHKPSKAELKICNAWPWAYTPFDSDKHIALVRPICIKLKLNFGVFIIQDGRREGVGLGSVLGSV